MTGSRIGNREKKRTFRVCAEERFYYANSEKKLRYQEHMSKEAGTRKFIKHECENNSLMLIYTQSIDFTNTIHCTQ